MVFSLVLCAIKKYRAAYAALYLPNLYLRFYIRLLRVVCVSSNDLFNKSSIALFDFIQHIPAPEQIHHTERAVI